MSRFFPSNDSICFVLAIAADAQVNLPAHGKAAPAGTSGTEHAALQQHAAERMGGPGSQNPPQPQKPQ